MINIILTVFNSPKYEWGLVLAHFMFSLLSLPFKWEDELKCLKCNSHIYTCVRECVCMSVCIDAGTFKHKVNLPTCCKFEILMIQKTQIFIVSRKLEEGGVPASLCQLRKS